MFHTIEFCIPGLAELELPGSARLMQVYIECGTRVRTEVWPYVVDSDDGPIEVADLMSNDGIIARAVRFETFRFVDE